MRRSLLRKFSFSLVTLMVLQALWSVCLAQQKVTGQVTSATDGEPLIGATVKVAGTSTGTVTDFDGNYQISAQQGQTLEVSYIGFLTKAVKVTGGVMNITLDEDKKTLDEVVVVGYGTMKRSDITGSVVSVTGEEIKKSVVTSVDQALQGRAAGVQVTQNSGSPGGGISVSIRGVNSLNGNEPLYIIDGIAVGGNTGDNSSALSNLNPSDIVSMEVLKDASATAIYGSRASNGVVIIKTRQGEKGQTRIGYEGYLGIQQLPKTLDVLNLQEFAQFYNARAAVYGFGEREDFRDPSLLTKGTDWQREIFRTALMHNHQLSVSGGTEGVTFAISGSYLNQEGIAIGSEFERFTTRANVEVKAYKWLTIGLNGSLANSTKENTVEGSDYDEGSRVIATAIRQRPDVAARNPDGSYGVMADGDNMGLKISNPIADAMMRENRTKTLDANITAYASIDFYKDLNLRVEYGGNYNYGKNYQYTPVYDFGTFQQTSSGQRTASNSRYMSFKTYATYNHTWVDRHAFTAMVGHEVQEGSYESLMGSRTGYISNYVHELGAGDAQTAKNSSSVGEWSIESYFTRLNYSYDDRYLLTATVRADGSSAFGPNNRWGYFPSVAAAWKIGNEKFMQRQNVVNGLKLRFGWGLVGNQSVGNYAYGSTMNTFATIWGTGYVRDHFANPDLKWETTKAWNAGLDFTLLRNRIEVILDAYLKNTDNMLMDAALPMYGAGVIGAPKTNIGAMRNKGYEITVNTVNIDRKGFLWKTGLTFSRNINEVTKLNTESAGISGSLSGTTYTYSVVGQPVGQFYGYKVAGMFRTEDDFYAKDKNGDYLLDANGNRKFVALPSGKTVKEGEIWLGDYIWEDLNKDGVIDEGDLTFIGNPQPKFTFGLNNTLSWKGFDLTIFINGSVGGKIYNYMAAQNSNPNSFAGLMSAVKDYARVEKIDPAGGNDLANLYVPNNAAVQRLTMTDANDNNRTSDRFVENGTYVRLKNIALGYTFPKRLTEKWHIQNLRVYANIQNLVTITGYDGMDPEIGAYHQNVLLTGIDFARYPSQRIYTFGLNINF